MDLLYIAGPYRSNDKFQKQQNIFEASLMAQYYWKRGYAVFCPHKNSGWFDGVVFDGVFLQADLLFMEHCKYVAFHERWMESEGCIKEQYEAKKSMKVCFYPSMKEIADDLNVALTMDDYLRMVQ